MPPHLGKTLAFIWLYLSSQYVFAQTDAHFWTHQYGSKGLLLNGAVIASPDGETSAFYNPGAIGIDDDLGFSFSFITPTYVDLKTMNILGDEHSMSDKGIGFAPDFFGLRVRPFKEKKITVGISKFRRYNSNITLTDRQVAPVNGFPELIYRVDLDFTRKISEQWIGLGLAYNLGDNIGIGVSQFSVWHSQNYSLEIENEIQASNAPNTISQFSRNASNYRFSLNSAFISKLGFSYKSEKFNFGLTYTSPLYGILQKSASYSLENQIVDTVNEQTSSTSNRNNTSNVQYKTPHSIGMGIDLHSRTTTISISSEYFFGIDEYSILNEVSDSYNGLSTVPNETLFRVKSENEAVLNFAVGIQKEMSERITWVVGFRTDYNPKNKLEINNNPVYLGILGNVYHLSGGGMFNFRKNQFSCGFDFGFGKNTDGVQLVDLSTVSPSTFSNLSEQENVSSQFNSFMLFITYDFMFNRFRKKDL